MTENSGATLDPEGTPLSDDDIETAATSDAPVPGGDADGTDGGDADGADADGTDGADADGTDGDASDSSDGDASDA